MSSFKQLEDLHAQVTADIIASRTAEMAALRAEYAAEAKAADARAAEALPLQAKQLGVSTKELDKMIAERSAEGDRAFKAADASMTKASESLVSEAALPDFSARMVPDGVSLLTPSWMAGFSTADDSVASAQASKAVTRDILTGGGTADYWNWASGAGWGCLGSGVGQNQQWVDFGFWFRPPSSKFYSIQPLFRYRGFYILQADDGFWDCKNARTVVSAWVNVYQYNWKGWNSVNVLDRSGDNINVNTRLDLDRSTYNSYLLGGGDWAWIQCTIGLYVRAQGGGSYAKNDFATGAANYLSVPYAYVY